MAYRSTEIPMTNVFCFHKYFNRFPHKMSQLTMISDARAICRYHSNATNQSSHNRVHGDRGLAYARNRSIRSHTKLQEIAAHKWAKRANKRTRANGQFSYASCNCMELSLLLILGDPKQTTCMPFNYLIVSMPSAWRTHFLFSKIVNSSTIFVLF